MPERANERTAYHNGRFLPEREVLVPFRDRGFLYGDAAFDTTRTFRHDRSGFASTSSGSTGR
jgi:branched-chain amino acid aminotransferase